MRYQVPQFIEIESKIIGPLTIKQFIYLAGGAGMAFIFYTILPLYIAMFFMAGVITLSLALAFYKINNKPFIDFLESAFIYYTKSKLYIWKKQSRIVEHKEVGSTVEQVFLPKLSDSKLKDLSWSLGVNENINPVTGPNGRNTK